LGDRVLNNWLAARTAAFSVRVSLPDTKDNVPVKAEDVILIDRLEGLGMGIDICALGNLAVRLAEIPD